MVTTTSHTGQWTFCTMIALVSAHAVIALKSHAPPPPHQQIMIGIREMSESAMVEKLTDGKQDCV